MKNANNSENNLQRCAVCRGLTAEGLICKSCNQDAVMRQVSRGNSASPVRKSKPGYEGQYWCCGADFGSHESDCPNSPDHCACGDEIPRWFPNEGDRQYWHEKHRDHGMAESVSGEPPRAEPPEKIKMGFLVRIEMHTKDAELAITSPEALRFQIGHMMDSWGIQEEVDYTLEVSRTYENE